MMSSRNKIIIIALIGLLLVVAIVSISIGASNSKSNESGIDSKTISSPFTRSSIDAVVYYKADYTPGDEDAVNTQYNVFGLDTLKVQDEIKNALRYGVPDYLKSHILQNAEPVYVQLDVDSVNYSAKNNYSFNFYIDSPEGYYSYTASPLDNDQSTITITPIGGGWL